jgi:hypothetical protein
MPVGDAIVAMPGPDGDACVTIRPERLRLDPDGPLELQVLEAIYTGTGVRLKLADRELRLEATVPPAVAPVAGEWVGIALPLEDIWRIPSALPADAAGEPDPDLERWRS